MTAAAAVGACAESPWSSALFSSSLKPRLPDLFASSIATWAALTSLMPSCWLLPDSGPWKAILYVWPLEPPRPAPELELPAELELLPLEHAVSASEPASASGRTHMRGRVDRIYVPPVASRGSCTRGVRRKNVGPWGKVGK